MWVEDKTSKKLNREGFFHFGFLFVREVLVDYSVSKREKFHKEYHSVEWKSWKGRVRQSVILNE